MPKFQFRMQKLLDYRLRLESAAKDAYLLARARRLSGEGELEMLVMNRQILCGHSAATLGEMMQKHSAIARLQDEEDQMKSAINVLLNEEEAAQLRYLEAKRTAEGINKLRDRAWELWQKEEEKREQAEIDEWAVTRRSA